MALASSQPEQAQLTIPPIKNILIYWVFSPFTDYFTIVLLQKAPRVQGTLMRLSQGR